MAAANLELSVDGRGPRLVLEVRNVGGTEVRLWEQENSWGWPMPRVHVRATPHADPALTLRPADRVWTGNLPTALRLAPAESSRYELRADDLDRAALRQLRPFRERTLWVQGELRSEPSAEAAEYGVWCGMLLTPVTQLDPPHHWMGPSSEPSPGTSPG